MLPIEPQRHENGQFIFTQSNFLKDQTEGQSRSPPLGKSGTSSSICSDTVSGLAVSLVFFFDLNGFLECLFFEPSCDFLEGGAIFTTQEESGGRSQPERNDGVADDTEPPKRRGRRREEEKKVGSERASGR